MRKPTKKSLKKKLKTLCSALIYQRDKGICQWCGNKPARRGAHAHHIVAVSICNQYGRYELKNLVLLCMYCHFTRLKAEVDEYIIWRNMWLFERDLHYDTMRSWYNKPVKLVIADYEYLYEELEKFKEQL